MSLIWIFTLIVDTPITRKLAAYGSLTLRVLLHFFWYGYQLYVTGKAQGYMCSEEKLAEMNQANADDHLVTEEECLKDTKILMTVDLILKTCIASYFTSVVFRWSNQSKTDYERA